MGGQVESNCHLASKPSALAPGLKEQRLRRKTYGPNSPCPPPQSRNQQDNAIMGKQRKDSDSISIELPVLRKDDPITGRGPFLALFQGSSWQPSANTSLFCLGTNQQRQRHDGRLRDPVLPAVGDAEWSKREK
jgi:hypothetical protein